MAAPVEREALDPSIKRPARFTWKAGVVLLVLFVATFFAAQTCQQRQVRITSEQAVVTARKQADFAATRTQVRLVRQGLNGHPFWAVSLSIPKRDGGYAAITTVRVDANTGKVAAVTRETTPTLEEIR